MNARWLWERIPPAVRSDDEICRMWEVAKLLWNGDMPAAYVKLANSGGALVCTRLCRAGNHLMLSLSACACFVPCSIFPLCGAGSVPVRKVGSHGCNTD